MIVAVVERFFRISFVPTASSFRFRESEFREDARDEAADTRGETCLGVAGTEVGAKESLRSVCIPTLLLA